MLTCAFQYRAWVLGLTLVSSTFAGAAPVDAQAREEVPRYFFRVEIDGIGSGSFRSVSGLGIETEVIEFREGGDAGFVRKLPGATKWPDIVLTRGFTGDAKLYDWATAYRRTGKVEKRTGVIVMLEAGGGEVARWTFVNGWPSKWDGPSLNTSHDVAVETLVIVHEGLLP